MANFPNESSNQNPNEKKEGGKIPIIICSILTAWALLALIIGFLLKSPYVIIAGIIPAALYETWRTEGFYTKAVSAVMAILAIVEIFVIAGILKLGAVSGSTEVGERIYVSGYFLPLVDVKFLIPAGMIACAAALIYWTYGVYTKWLSVVLTISAIGLLYLMNKEVLIEMIRSRFIY